jgi:hypothetical protein
MSAATTSSPPIAKPVNVVTAPSKGLNGGLRICISMLVAVALGLFMLLWDGGFIPLHGLRPWIGPLVILPLIAVVLSFGSNALIQQLSCNQVQWIIQLQRVGVVPIPFLLLWAALYYFPIMRWPIEGMVQTVSPNLRRGLSSGFYTFWMGLYTQGVLNGLSQICPK